ncbi:MAG: GMC family oxidoreductase [Rhodothermales bacterium]
MPTTSPTHAGTVHIARPAEPFDAIVVGSGMSGGIVAKELTEQGLKVLLLERGRHYEHGAGYTTEHRAPWEFPYRGEVPPAEERRDYAVQSLHYSFSDATRRYFIKDSERPYVQEAPYRWIAANIVGGRSILWARQSYRWSDLDFEANARDGVGVDWPIRYADVLPWYEYIERFVGITGSAEGLPQLPDSLFLPPMEMNVVEKAAKAGIEARFPERKLIIGRAAVLSQAHNGRAACHYCGPCERGCSTASYYSTLGVALPVAMATGNLTLRPDSVVHSVIYDAGTNRATGVRVIDANTKEMTEVSGRLVFLCASTLGTAQIMLNSTSRTFPNGIANSSGVLGHYLLDHHAHLGASGQIEGYEDRYYYGNRPNGVYVPRFRNVNRATRRSDYLRGFGFQGSASRSSWSRGRSMPGFGADFKHALRDPGPWQLGLGGFGETLPNYDNHCRLDPDTVDAWGMPILRLNVTRGENERAMRKDILATAGEMLEAAGAKNIRTYENESPPGFGNHEMGSARMGRDPKTSVLNGNNQTHDVPNLFVTDGACMTSSACQNPSLTYMALSARAAHFAVDAMKRGDL